MNFNDLSVFLVIIAIFYFWYKKQYSRYYELVGKIPSSKPLPIIGNGMDFINKHPVEILKILTKYSEQYGPIWKFELPQANVVIHDPKVMEEILSSQKLIDKASEYDYINDWLGTGLLISTGKKWHQRRKIITPTFHFKILEQFVDIMESQGQTFVSKLKESKGQVIDVYPLISLYALDVICGKYKLFREKQLFPHYPQKKLVLLFIFKK
jgi:cytochrome P450 family 4